jgi:hypothetical protein
MKSVGALHYSIEPLVGHKLIVSADQELVEYYRALLPRSMPVNQQRHPAHISVIRRVVPHELSSWGKYEGEPVEFEYSNIVEWDERYCWLPVSCPRLEAIRIELGLEARVPWRNGFHMTIGNFKDIA